MVWHGVHHKGRIPDEDYNRCRHLWNKYKGGIHSMKCLYSFKHELWNSRSAINHKVLPFIILRIWIVHLKFEIHYT